MKRNLLGTTYFTGLSFSGKRFTGLLERESDVIHITGDTHGDLGRVYSYCKRIFAPAVTEDDYILVCGDFGMLWNTMPTKDSFPDLPCPVLFVDGNHENFDLLRVLPRKEMFGSKVGVVEVGGREVAYHLLRGCVYEIQGKTFFSMGGGVSIDKAQRIEGVNWWREEVPSALEGQRVLYNAENVGEVDYVVTHAAPHKALDLVRDSMFRQAGRWYAEAKIREMKQNPVTRLLTEVDKLLTYKEWFFGHYHFNGSDGKYTCLYKQWAVIGK